MQREILNLWVAKQVHDIVDQWNIHTQWYVLCIRASKSRSTAAERNCVHLCRFPYDLNVCDDWKSPSVSPALISAHTLCNITLIPLHWSPWMHSLVYRIVSSRISFLLKQFVRQSSHEFHDSSSQVLAHALFQKHILLNEKKIASPWNYRKYTGLWPMSLN